MSRPTILHVGGVQRWVIRLYNSSGALVDADSTPTVAVRKNGSSTADSVTVTKRSATTGIYDCSYDPAGEAEGDKFTIEETATISSTSYSNSWQFAVIAVERGTDGANTTSPLDAAGTRAALGLAAADLDAQLLLIDNEAAAAATAAEAVQVVTDKLNDTLENNAGTYRFTAAGLAQAPAGATTVNILPIVSTVGAGEVSTTEIVGYESRAGSWDWLIVDSNGDAIDLSAVALRFRAFRLGSQETVVYERTSADGDITVAGAGSNMVTVTATPANQATPGEYGFVIDNVDDASNPSLLAHGKYTVNELGAA